MIPDLMKRLARVEAEQAAEDETTPIHPALVGTYLWAIAIGLGGYPRAPEPSPPHRQDNISDGFARGLGYINREDMEARLEADPDEWQRRMKDAETVLAARYVKDPDAEGMGRGWAFQMMVGALDEIGRAKAAKLPGAPYHWPSEEPQLDRAAKSIRQALFGIVSEEGIAEACT